MIVPMLVLALSLISDPSPVAPPPPGEVRLTLAEALERARAASPRLSELESLATAADAAARGARAETMPQIDLSAGYARTSDVPEFRLTLPGLGTRTLFPNIPDNYRLHAGASMPLWTGGRIEASVAAADRQREAAAFDRAGSESDLVLETSSAYWRLVTARESARVLGEAVAAYEAHLKDAKNRLDYGVAARNEVLAVQVERDRAELSRLQAGNAAEIAGADLVRLTGLPPGSRVEPTEPLTESAEIPPLPGWEGGVAGEGDRGVRAPDPGDTEALVSAAFGARPELKALQARVDAARAAMAIQRAATRPQAVASLGYDYADPNPRIVPQRDEFRGTWNAGVTVSLKVFDGGRAAAAAAEAIARADALERQLVDRKERLRLDVTSRLLDLRTARAEVAVAARNLDAARENLKVAQDRYREGVLPSSELLDAETNLLRAGLDQTSAATQVRVAQAALDRSVGRPGAARP